MNVPSLVPIYMQWNTIVELTGGELNASIFTTALFLTIIALGLYERYRKISPSC